jgi:predicted secreted protein
MRIAALIIAIAVAAPALAAEVKPGADKEKLICKREVPVGSLIASRKTCLTKAQWVQRELDGNEEARKMIYDNQGRPTSN